MLGSIPIKQFKYPVNYRPDPASSSDNCPNVPGFRNHLPAHLRKSTHPRGHTRGHAYKQTDSQTDRQTDRHTDRQTDILIVRKTNIEILKGIGR